MDRSTSGSADTTERMKRLALQKQKLLEQRKRLAGSKPGSEAIANKPPIPEPSQQRPSFPPGPKTPLNPASKPTPAPKVPSYPAAQPSQIQPQINPVPHSNPPSYPPASSTHPAEPAQEDDDSAFFDEEGPTPKADSGQDYSADAESQPFRSQNPESHPPSNFGQAEPPITNSNVQGTQANRFQTQTQDSNPQVAPKTQSTFFSPFTAPSQHPEPEPTASFPVEDNYAQPTNGSVSSWKPPATNSLSNFQTPNPGGSHSYYNGGNSSTFSGQQAYSNNAGGGWKSHSQNYAQASPQEMHLRGPESSRPPCALIAFGFGGKVVTLRPILSAIPSADGQRHHVSGPLCLHSTATLSQTLFGQHPPEEANDESTYKKLKTFPLVTPSLSKDKLKKGVLDSIKKLEEQYQSAKIELELLFWKIALLVVDGEGSLQPSQNSLADQKFGRKLAELINPQGTSQFGSSTQWNQTPNLSKTILKQGLTANSSNQELTAIQIQNFLRAGDTASALRSACEEQLWGLALALSHLLGEQAFKGTVSQMVSMTLNPSCGLHSFFSAISGFPQQPDPHTSWQESLGMLLSNRNLFQPDALSQFGDKLWETSPGNAEVSQLCYLLGGIFSQPFSKTAQMCLPLSDHRNLPRTYISIEALQRGLLLSWINEKGQNPAKNVTASMLPYTFLYASYLAEYGLIVEASRLCSTITNTFNALGAKIPAALLVTRIATNELQVRLQTHAQALNIQIPHSAEGSMMKKASKWLDRGLSKLIGISDLPENPSNPNNVQPVHPAHRRANSLTETPKDHRAERRVSSALDMSTHAISRASTPVNHPQNTSASLPASPTPPSKVPSESGSQTGQAMGKANSISMRGLMSKVGSFTSLLSSPGVAKADDDNLGTENTRYYDNELKIWRTPGEPAPQITQNIGPPPKAIAPMPLSTEPGSTKDVRPPPPTQNLSKLPASIPATPQSRYVDTMANSSRPPGGVTQPKPNQAPPFLPVPKPVKPNAPNFFVPSQNPNQQTNIRPFFNPNQNSQQRQNSGPQWNQTRQG